MSMDTQAPTPEELQGILAPYRLHDAPDLVERLGQMIDRPAHPATVLACTYMLQMAPVHGEDGTLSWWVGPHEDGPPWMQVDVVRGNQQGKFVTRFPLTPEVLERDIYRTADPQTREALFQGYSKEDRSLVWRYLREDAQESARCQEGGRAIQAGPLVEHLHDAIARDDRQGMEDALWLGATVHGADKEGNRALHVAAREKQHELVKHLVDAGADLNAINLAGQTALHMAAAKQCPKTCVVLLALGADAARRDHRGRSPLDLAKARHREHAHVQGL